jgi:hypothetical protein
MPPSLVWTALAAAMFCGGIIGAAIGTALWWPAGAAMIFTCGLLTGVAAIMLARMAE